MRQILLIFISLFLICPPAFAQEAATRDENGYRAPTSYEEAVSGYYITINATHPMGMSNRTKYAEKVYNFGKAKFGKGSVKTAELAMAWLKAFEAYPAGTKSPRTAFTDNIETLEKTYHDTPEKLVDPYYHYGNILLKVHHVRSIGKVKKYINKAVDILQTTKGKNSLDEAKFHQNISVSYQYNANRKLAHKHHKRAISIYSNQGNTFNQRPIPILKFAPKYPNNEKEGWVMVEFTVNRKGRVKGAKAVDFEGPNSFKSAAVVAANKFLYIPQIKNGKAIETKGVKNKITFQWKK